MQNLLRDQVIIVTGGSSGIGKGITSLLAREGALLAIFGLDTTRGEETIRDVQKEIPGANIRFYPVDVSLTQPVESTIQTVIKDYGQIDILINNAGITEDTLLMRMSENQWDRVLAVNLKSCFNTSRIISRHMMKREKGKIINISSVVGITGNAGQANYAASKAGMIGFTKTLAKELASRNILVNAIAPGFIETRMTNKLNEKQKETILPTIPLGRFGHPTDIASMVWFLASPLSNYITGQVFVVDGGMVI